MAEEPHLSDLGATSLCDLLLELGNASVLKLGHSREIAAALSRLQFHPGPFQRFLDMLYTLDFGLLRLPDFFEIGELPLCLGDFGFQSRKPFARRVVALLAERLALDLELNHPSLETIHGLGLGVDLHPNPARGLVHQIDRLVGKLTVRDVAVGQRRSSDDCGVADVHPVVYLVAFLQSAQYGDRVFHAGFIDQDLLKTPFERSILLDVPSVLVECGRAHAVQITARERGLQHVAGVHRAFGLAGAHQGVNLVDEQDDLALLLGQVVEHGLHPFLEFAPELRSGNQRTHVQGQQALSFQALRDFGVHDPLRQTFDDGGLADSGLADQHRVVLRTSLQHLDGPADFVIAANDRIELPLLGALGEVDCEFLEGSAVLFRIRIRHRLAATNHLDRFRDRLLRCAVVRQEFGHASTCLEAGQYEQLARYESILALLGELVAKIEVPRQVAGNLHVACRAVDPGQRVECNSELRAQRIHVHPCLRQKVAHRGALLVEQGGHHVYGFQELVVVAEREALSVGERHLELGRELVCSHRELPSPKPGFGAWPTLLRSISDRCGCRGRNQAVPEEPKPSRAACGSRPESSTHARVANRPVTPSRRWEKNRAFSP